MLLVLTWLALKVSVPLTKELALRGTIFVFEVSIVLEQYNRSHRIEVFARLVEPVLEDEHMTSMWRIEGLDDVIR
jgi:hypothetical protein